MKKYFRKKSRKPELKFFKHRYGVIQRTEVTEEDFFEACGDDAEKAREFFRSLKSGVFHIEQVVLSKGTKKPSNNLVLISTYQDSYLFYLGSFETIMYKGDYYTIQVKLENFEMEISDFDSLKKI